MQQLMTHPGVGPITALAFVLVLGTAEAGANRLSVGGRFWSIPAGNVFSPGIKIATDGPSASDHCACAYRGMISVNVHSIRSTSSRITRIAC